ncbi:hypothetical protein [Rappaport israeli]|uniref:hypothetical protein n=1 Tax=Rappaport israeli TaxID=1839807 RepID=UPI00093012BA|nr:hypothetical protein [Rappaport israeli]
MAIALLPWAETGQAETKLQVKIEDLGTLRRDLNNPDDDSLSTGKSWAVAIDPSGEVVVGWADNSQRNTHASAWRYEGKNGVKQWSAPVDLGTLNRDLQDPNDNSKSNGVSRANAISADGSAVVGEAYNESWYGRASVWRYSNGKWGAP